MWVWIKWSKGQTSYTFLWEWKPQSEMTISPKLLGCKVSSVYQAYSEVKKASGYVSQQVSAFTIMIQRKESIKSIKLLLLWQRETVQYVIQKHSELRVWHQSVCEKSRRKIKKVVFSECHLRSVGMDFSGDDDVGSSDGGGDVGLATNSKFNLFAFFGTCESNRRSQLSFNLSAVL